MICVSTYQKEIISPILRGEAQNCSDYVFCHLNYLGDIFYEFCLPIVQLNVYITQICSQPAIKNNHYVPNSFPEIRILIC